MQDNLKHILDVITSSRFPVDNEKDLQSAIESKFIEKKVEFIREHRLDDKNIPDFFIDGIAIEVKIKGNAKSIYKQCVRYCEFNEVKILILLTNRSIGFPKEINGKPCYLISLGKSWL